MVGIPLEEPTMMILRPETLANLAVGQNLWVRDLNTRVYPKEGGAGSSPVWLLSWREIQVIGTTKKDWTLGWNSDGAVMCYIDKKTGLVRASRHTSMVVQGIVTSYQELLQLDWAVRNCSSVVTAVTTARSQNPTALMRAARELSLDVSGFPADLPAREQVPGDVVYIEGEKHVIDTVRWLSHTTKEITLQTDLRSTMHVYEAKWWDGAGWEYMTALVVAESHVQAETTIRTSKDCFVSYKSRPGEVYDYDTPGQIKVTQLYELVPGMILGEPHSED